MSYVEVTEEGWFSRIGDSIKGILTGIILIIAAIPCIFWNECRAVKRANDLEAGSGAVVSVKADKVEAGNQNKLVHMTGSVKVDEVLTDSTFGVSEKGLKLVRDVEMYQWTEKSKSSSKKKVGGKKQTVTEYTYERGWSSSVVNSDKFKDPEAKKKKVNPTQMKYERQEFSAGSATVGAFTLSPAAISSLSSAKDFPLSELPKEIKSNKSFQLDKGAIYFGKDPSKPEIGDLRISYKLAKPDVISIVARQNSGRLEAYKTKSMSSSILLVEEGTKGAEQMFKAAQAANATMTWVLRVIAFLALFGGFAMIFRPLSVVADVIPFIGSVVGTASTFFAFLLGGMIWFVCTAMAWVVARPLIGILMLLVAGAFTGGIIFLVMKSKKT